MIISILIGLWLLNAAVEIFVGLIQILFGLIVATLGASILTLMYFLEGLVILWKTAFPKNTSCR